MVLDDEAFKKLISTRNVGKVTYGIEKREAENEKWMNDLLVKMGHNSSRIEHHWRSVTREYAHQILEFIFTMEMTHNLAINSKPFAHSISNCYLNQFGPEAEFYTNGLFDTSDGSFKLYAWTSITDGETYTYDTGVIGIDTERIGILWATDPM
ncbi:hypothetical protein MKY59_14210 [Paenibacillus sp. FSL W8-0426]|uniref:hypothetical protein n=2 Tax=unclassified Paenibacillus TaxID=185978 RepID=UPI0030DBC016